MFGGICLTEVKIGSHESFEQALRRFNKLVQQTGVLAEARRREHYESPSIRRKKKAAAKRRKSMRNSQRGYS
jgi:small subunit ribosomal protein S21